MKHYTEQFINGVWQEGTSTSLMENYNPFTGELIYRYQAASQQDVDDAYQAAQIAQIQWAKTLPEERKDYLKKLATIVADMEQEIFDLLCEESGGTKAKFAFEYGDTLKVIDDAMAYHMMMNGKIMPSNVLGKDNYVYKIPKGVITVIAPFNFPLLLSMRSIVPAIACGNTVVVKPSSETPGSAFLIAEMFEKAGFPKGVINVVAGRGSEIGDYIVSHPTSSLISFTGSTEVGQHIGKVAGELLKDVSLELGGNQAMIVLEDADVDQAAKAAVIGAYSHQGQICMAINRILVTPNVRDQFIKSFVAYSKEVKVGDPTDEEVFIGPLINERQAQKVAENLQATIKAGAKVELEGKIEKSVVHPWILSNVTNDMCAAKCEMFAPVCSIITVKNEEEAIKVANDTEYGLSNSIFTKDLYKGLELAKQLHSGMAHVNDQSITHEPHVMFGGEKYSGVGRFNGQWVIDKFTTEKWISVQKIDRY
ncbi:aldehyde dehydrogenase family protein [Enterococcus rivorum]|uniref:3-sulfolactaldehyde dehydrogenase n=1 Tax=Enterococcus rivorum TaxID=762845 RepID=A0A1E5KV00_9ENTE|nr:aldehyde dehydrogenase family protein [Enterococcus rivorum]MBP2099073.1 aldehyde dehydrogenase (NAD+) [Enterococcus rivorum]OEH81670.1 aldehyde dehydrogenase [Enterococcus rivorum]